MAGTAVAWSLFSAVVGAGFASGRELVLFLGPCGRWGPAAAAAVGLAVGVAAALPPPGSPAAEPGDTPAGTWPAGLYGVASAGLAWATLVAMVAALAHLAGPRASGATLAVAAAAVWAASAAPPGSGLAAVSRVLGPAIAAGLLAETAGWAARGPAGSGGGLLPTGQGALHACLSGAALYVSGNALFAQASIADLLRSFSLGRFRALAACAAGGGLVGLAGAAGLWTIGRAATAREPMPLLMAAAALDPAAGEAHRLVVAAAAYTTAVAAACALVSLAQGAARRRVGGWERMALAAAVVASTLPLARQGFVEAVHRLYPLAGWAALAALALGWAFAMAAGRRLY